MHQTHLYLLRALTKVFLLHSLSNSLNRIHPELIFTSRTKCVRFVRSTPQNRIRDEAGSRSGRTTGGSSLSGPLNSTVSSWYRHRDHSRIGPVFGWFPWQPPPPLFPRKQTEHRSQSSLCWWQSGRSSARSSTRHPLSSKVKKRILANSFLFYLFLFTSKLRCPRRDVTTRDLKIDDDRTVFTVV